MSEFEDYVEAYPLAYFTQSEMWASVKSDWVAEHVAVTDSFGRITGAAQILIKRVPLLNISFMYAPRGPICNYHSLFAVENFMKEVDRIQQKYNGFMLKIDPLVDSSDTKAIENLLHCGFNFTPNVNDDKTVQCRSNYILRLSGRGEEEILNSFHKKWRYNIRLSQRKEVVCNYYGTDKLDDFYALLIETAERDKFNIRSKGYFKRIMESFGEKCRLYMCYYRDIPLSGAIAINYGGRVSYLYGASTQKLRNLMPCYLMQWNMIKWAIDTGCEIYDFMGVPHYDDETHPNYGVYRFKKGFNGEVVSYAGEFDYIFYPKRKSLVSAALKMAGKSAL